MNPQSSSINVLHIITVWKYAFYRMGCKVDGKEFRSMHALYIGPDGPYDSVLSNPIFSESKVRIVQNNT